MSLPSKEKDQDFKVLYTSLKAEYDQSLLDNDEMFKEYESTIELLKNALKKATEEKEKLQNKNKEKLIDIQDLTKMNDKLKEDIKTIKDEKKFIESKIVFLETDNDHFQKKIRQFEAIIDDLNSELESALEENITMQTEFEIYKQNTTEELMRKDEELQDCKSDIVNKEKIIQQLNTKKIMRELEEKMKMNQKSLNKIQRKYSDNLNEKDKEKEKNDLDIHNNNSVKKMGLFKSTNENYHNKTEAKNSNETLITPLLNCKVALPGKFQEIYRKSIKNAMQLSTPKRFENVEKKINLENDKNNDVVNIDKKNSIFNVDSQGSSSTQTKINDNEKEKEEDNVIKDEIEQDASSCFSSEKKIFEYLVICNEKVFSINSVKNLLNDNLMKNKKIKENLQKLLILKQQRKNSLKTRRINIKERLNKIGYKIRD